MTEYRAETCPDCGETRERVWIVKDVGVKLPVPPGYRVVKRTTSRKRIAVPTRDTTLCLCDAP